MYVELGESQNPRRWASLNPFPSLKLMTFAVTFSSLSFALTSSSSYPPFPPSKSKFPFSLSLKFPLSSSPPAFSPSQDLAADIISLLGGDKEAFRVPANEADEIRSCLRFLVLPNASRSFGKRELLLEVKGNDKEQEDGMVLWPPPPVMELARLAVDSRGDPEVIQRSLDPTVLKVPDVEDLVKDKCQLTKTPTAFRFASKELNSYFAFLFELISARAPLVGFNVSLSRYDLFHGHIFLARRTGRLGVLFHAKEYPAYDKNLFPYNTGYCQTGSNVVYDDSINLRNILWLAPLPSSTTKAWLAPGALVVLDAHPGGIIYRTLVPDYVDYVRTIYEDEFGEVVADVNYLGVADVVPGDRIFIC